MPDKKAHGGKREGAGRKPVEFGLIMKVGQACLKLEQQAYQEQKRSLLEDQTNLQEFFDYINSIPVNERKDFIGSDDHIEHSKLVDEEARSLERPAYIHGNPSRLLHLKKPHGSQKRIRREVAEAFGISENQVKNYLQNYRAFVRQID